MAKISSELSDVHRTFISRQKVYFVASAPNRGRVNLSPKGLDSFRILGETRVGYLDATGSGNETAAHVAENGRITLMFCSFEGAPLILRCYGRGRAVHSRDAEWTQLRPLFGPPLPGERQLIVVDIESVQTSCGFGVPLFDFVAHRTALPEWSVKKGPAGIAAYWSEKNQRSIDNLPTSLFEITPSPANDTNQRE